MERINLEHKSLIEHIRKKYGHELSSHAFNSLYLWQDEMKLSLICRDNFFAVKCGVRGKNSWFFPCGDENKIYDFISEHMSECDFSMCYLRECDVKWLNENFPEKWKFNRDETADEYICKVGEYVSLDGSKFSEIRRKIRKLDKEFDISAMPISKDNLADAEDVISRWQSVGHIAGKDGISDDSVSEKAISDMQNLDISGVVLYADGAPVSVFAGFALTADTLDVLVGKCVPNSPKGAAHYALREYLRLCGEKFTYCNHEEDLGIEGIRYMKNSLCPISKTAIWEATPV